MARRRRPTYKKSSGSRKRRARSRDGDGDGDDDDYVAGEEDESESSYESDVSPRDSSAEESFDFGEFSSGSEEDMEVAASKRRRASSAAPKKPRRRPRAPHDDEEEPISAPRRKARAVGSRRRKSRVLDLDEKEDDDDEDFSPDEEDDDYEEDVSPVAGKRSRSGRKVAHNRRKSKVMKPKEKKTRKPAAVPARKRHKIARSDDDDDFIVRNPVVADNQRKKRKKVRRKKTASRKTKRYSVDLESLDSDFMVSDDDFVGNDRSNSDFVVSDDDFIGKHRVTVDRQRKKSKTPRKKKTSSRRTKKRRLEVSDSSDSEFVIPEEEVRDLVIGGIVNQAQPKRIFAGRKSEKKGKEKEADVVEKQVCGICLSEEQKTAVQGVLNCCSHYFCFACILEWSKVESRCPVCKRRFVTISKSSRSDQGFGLRRAVIRVQKRDQVYQPSEEDMQGMLIPYENVVCMVCQQAGDDNLMLLCDGCDSPAHTFCVGLGWEVPEGDWYCEGCRSTDDRSSNSHDQDIAIIQGMSSSDLFLGGIETADLGVDMRAGTSSRQSVSFPGTSSLSFDLNVPPAQLPAEDHGVMSQASGAGSSSFSRRRAIHQHVRDLETEDLSTNIRAGTNSRQSIPFPGEFSSQRIDLNFPPRHLLGEDHGVASQASGAGASTLSGRRAIHRHIRILLSDSRPSQVFSGIDVPRCDVENGATTSEVGLGVEAHISGGLNPFHTASGTQRHQLNTRHIFQSNANSAPSMFSEGSSFRHVDGAKEQVQSMVRSRLKDLSRDSSIDRDIFKKIARHSTHTILAACGIEHHRSMVAAAVEPPDGCSHLLDGGQAVLMRGCCASCFGSFVRDVVSKLMSAQLEQEG